MAKGRKAISLEERFWSKVDKNGPVPTHRPELGPCWTWTAGCYSEGYGMLGADEGKRTKVGAHRVAFYLQHGRWPVPCALHQCDNRKCVRWSHLFEGSKGDNNADARSKGRHSHGESHASALRARNTRGERNVMSRLTEPLVIEIRESTESLDVLAAKYGVSRATIGLARQGKTWAHVKIGAPPRTDRPRASRTPDDVRGEIKRRHAAGETYKHIGEALGVNAMTVYHIVRRGKGSEP